MPIPEILLNWKGEHILDLPPYQIPAHVYRNSGNEYLFRILDYCDHGFVARHDNCEGIPEAIEMIYGKRPPRDLVIEASLECVRLKCKEGLSFIPLTSPVFEKWRVENNLYKPAWARIIKDGTLSDRVNWAMRMLGCEPETTVTSDSSRLEQYELAPSQDDRRILQIMAKVFSSDDFEALTYEEAIEARKFYHDELFPIYEDLYQRVNELGECTSDNDAGALMKMHQRMKMMKSILYGIVE